MSDEVQALCFLAGANSIFVGPKLLTTDNPERDKDDSLFVRLGIERVSARAATFWTVLSGTVLLIALALAFNFSEMKFLKLSTIGWIAVMGVIAYPLARVLHNTAINMTHFFSVDPPPT